MRADARSSAKMLTLNPSGALSWAPSGLGITRDGFGFAGAGAGSCGCRCWPASTAEIDAAPSAIRMMFRFMVTPMLRVLRPDRNTSKNW
jgi:hypothetical protein